MSDKKYAEQLLMLARKDKNALCGMIGEEKNFDNSIFGFHAQQAVEKLLKALLAIRNLEFRKTHDLSILVAQIKESRLEFPETFFELTELTDYAVEYRYDLIMEEEQLNRRDIFEKVNKLYEFVKELIQK